MGKNKFLSYNLAHILDYLVLPFQISQVFDWLNNHLVELDQLFQGHLEYMALACN